MITMTRGKNDFVHLNIRGRITAESVAGWRTATTICSAKFPGFETLYLPNIRLISFHLQWVEWLSSYDLLWLTHMQQWTAKKERCKQSIRSRHWPNVTIYIDILV
jgi:hypothetical protein